MSYEWTYTVAWVDTVETNLAHCEDDSLSTIEGVAKNSRSVTHELFVCETALVDNLHLLHDG